MAQNFLAKVILTSRAILGDLEKTKLDSFSYDSFTGNIFTLSENNINDIIDVLKNGTSMGSALWSYNNGKVEIEVGSGDALSDGDVAEVEYTHYPQFSDTEITEAIRASLAWISLYNYKTFDLDTDIMPTPSTRDINLISIIVSILLKPDYTKYKTSSLEINFPGNASKEDRIKFVIYSFISNAGICGVIDYRFGLEF